MSERIHSAIPSEESVPQLNTVLFALAEAGRGIDALNGMRRMRNTQDKRKHPEMSEEALTQRKTLLDVSIRVMEKELFNDLDAAAEDWLRVRGRIK